MTPAELEGYRTGKPPRAPLCWSCAGKKVALVFVGGGVTRALYRCPKCESEYKIAAVIESALALEATS